MRTLYDDVLEQALKDLRALPPEEVIETAAQQIAKIRYAYANLQMHLVSAAMEFDNETIDACTDDRGVTDMVKVCHIAAKAISRNKRRKWVKWTNLPSLASSPSC